MVLAGLAHSIGKGESVPEMTHSPLENGSARMCKLTNGAYQPANGADEPTNDTYQPPNGAYRFTIATSGVANGADEA
jgi:hypothetical protein